jgi:hypothetical protein
MRNTGKKKIIKTLKGKNLLGEGDINGRVIRKRVRECALVYSALRVDRRTVFFNKVLHRAF